MLSKHFCLEIKQKYIDYMEKILCYLNIFVWIQQGYLTNMIFGLDPSGCVIKRLWCIVYFSVIFSNIAAVFCCCFANIFIAVLYHLAFAQHYILAFQQVRS